MILLIKIPGFIIDFIYRYRFNNYFKKNYMRKLYRSFLIYFANPSTRYLNNIFKQNKQIITIIAFRKHKISNFLYPTKKVVNIKSVVLFPIHVFFFSYRYDPPIPKPTDQPTVAAYDYAREINTPEGLDDLMADPDEMRMQALVIRERILGPAHPDTSYYIRYRGAVYADAGKFNRCIELWNYALDMQQSMLERLNPMTQSSLFSFAELFSFMIGEEGRPATRGRVVPPVEFTELLRVFNKAVKEVELGKY